MPKLQLQSRLSNLLLFKLSWFLLVFFQEGALAWGGLLLVVTMLLQLRTESAWTRAACIALTGVATDQLLATFGIFDFETELLPLWLAMLWLHFGMVLPCGFRFLQAWPRWAQSLAGAVTGPLSYWAGSLQGGVQFPLALYPTLLVLALVWALLLPGLNLLAELKMGPRLNPTSAPSAE